MCGVKVTGGCRKIPYHARLELLLDHQFLVLPESNCRIAHVTTLIWYLAYARHNGYSVNKVFKAMSENVIDSKGSGFADSDDEDQQDAE